MDRQAAPVSPLRQLGEASERWFEVDVQSYQAQPQSPLLGSSAAALCIIAVLLACTLPKILKKVRNRKEGSPMAKTLTWIGFITDTISLATAGAAVGGY